MECILAHVALSAHVAHVALSASPSALRLLAPQIPRRMRMRPSFCDISCYALQPPPPSAYTQPYSAEGFFTGVRSSISIQRSPAAVYDSLSRDLHKIFGPITVRNLGPL